MIVLFSRFFPHPFLTSLHFPPLASSPPSYLFYCPYGAFLDVYGTPRVSFFAPLSERAARTYGPLPLAPLPKPR